VRFVKRLVLQGYKTFASPTEFLFDAGVTAVVGPNGSGKSNIADALRWVLGEQSYGTLRGKRTEDMIFSGSEQRARLGMANVAVTLDNSSGWLPIDFTEVEIARRAYRSGDNEYYLNGNRVRLRDIVELLGGSGLSERTYSVIGQGLIDQALSQRPEERRRLFEEAAGITVHQSKRDQAAQRLEEARDNLTRAHDIMSELSPRLRYLKGQARRAQEYQQIRRDLDAQLSVWYGYRWRQAHMALEIARERAAEAALSAQEQADALGALVEQMAGRRHERGDLRERLTDWHRKSADLHREAEAIQRSLAVHLEQIRLWREQEGEVGRQIVDLQAAVEDDLVRTRAAQADLAEAQAAHEVRQQQVDAAERAMAQLERDRTAQVKRVAQQQDALLRLRSRIAESASRLSQLADRRAELAESVEIEGRAARDAAAQATEASAHIAAQEARVEGARAALGELDKGIEAHGHELSAAEEAERAALESLNTKQRAVARLQDQRDMLSRLRDEGAGLSSGARTVLTAGAERALQGVVGALGNLIEAPGELERAIEAALGGRVQDIVVRRWQDAEAAIALLKERRGGRATFLPLDTLRPARAMQAPVGPEILGRASDLVRFDAALRPAVELALGNILVVEDLPTARQLLGGPGNHAGGPTLVTRAGEIVRPTGSVTGGSEGDRRDSGMLSRSRTLRELEPQIAAGAEEVKGWQGRVDAARARQQTARAALADARARREAAAAQLQELNEDLSRLKLEAERARQSQRWHDEHRAQAVAEAERNALRSTELKAAIAGLTADMAAGDTVLEAERRALASLSVEDVLSDLARLRAEAAVSEGQLRSQRARVEELRGQHAARERELAQRVRRSQELSQSQADARASADRQEAADRALREEIAALTALIEPAEARLAEIEAEQRDAESAEQNLRELARQAQMRQAQADLALQRSHDELGHLRSEIEKELGLIALTTPEDEPPEDWDTQPPLPIADMVTQLPVVRELPVGLDADVRNLRAQISRLGPVNLEALNEYNEVEARFNFLTTQASDAEQAIASLEQIIEELDRLMEREFLATFRAVAEIFREEFQMLFGGGTARLVLTEPDSPTTTGVEIIARPPGKREQGLALLSGGERALTAAALIFSILRARPTPFCVMDEVDASLDEANIGRFREALRALSDQTQFILITHNRGTIEIADTIYGVSMGPDHTSQVLSLKLDGHDVVPARPSEAD
jgi:chromosome segregation protein